MDDQDEEARKQFINRSKNIVRKDQIVIEIRVDRAKKIEERQLNDRMNFFERFLWSENWFISYWDGLMCLWGIYLIILMPFDAFDKTQDYTFWIVINIITESIFIIDMILLLNRPFLYNGKWIIGKSKIVTRFKTFTFYLDILCLFPQFTVFYFTPLYSNYDWIKFLYVVKLL